jgi:hypothetical protein
MELKMAGLIEVDECGCLRVGNERIIERVADTFAVGDIVSVRYYITDKECSEEDAIKANIMRSIGAKIDDVDFILEAYSEWTILEYREKLKVCGHDLDLEDELRSFEGKYLNFVIKRF